MKPYLKNNRTNEVERGTVRRLHEHDLDEIMRVQDDAMSSIKDTATYVPGRRADFLHMLAHGEVQGMFAGGVLCGVCGILPANGDAGYLAEELGFDDAQRTKSVNLECYFVARDYRGNGIARELAHLCVERAQETFGARYILATVSPKNIPSLLTMMSINGFRIRTMRQLYGCKLRYVMCCEPASERLYTYYERFSIYDVYAISRCLAQGYEGIATFRSEEGLFVWLAK